MSPDLNPIEHIWGEIGHQVRAKTGSTGERPSAGRRIVTGVGTYTTDRHTQHSAFDETRLCICRGFCGCAYTVLTD